MFTVSIIIPNYNKEKHISKCIESVLEQDYLGIIEVIIVDDCSTDNSRRIIEELAKDAPIIKCIFLDKNERVSNARNVGIFSANGDYITCLDSDDYYGNKHKISNEMKVIESAAIKKRNVISYSYHNLCSFDGKTIVENKHKNNWYLEGNIYFSLVCDLNSQKVMRDYIVKRETIISVGGYNKNNSLFEDYELLLKLAKKCKFKCTYELGTIYRDSINGLSKRPKNELLAWKEKIIDEEIHHNSFLKRVVFTFVKSIVFMVRRRRNSSNES